MLEFATGALDSPPDRRDYPVEQFLPADVLAGAAAPLPDEWSFEGLMQPVRHQGAEGTCVGHALASGLMGYQQRLDDQEVLSVRDVYEGARRLQPPPAGVQGAYPRAALEWARTRGVCLESEWPYQPNAAGMPVITAENGRARNKLATYSRVAPTPPAIREAMYWHGPALVVVRTDGGWARPKDGRIVSAGLVGGAHAITLIGWSASRGCWRIRNSWGPDWADGGNAWLPWSWAISEAWVATPAKGSPPPLVDWLRRVAPWLGV